MRVESDVGVPRQPTIALGLVGRKIVENDVYLAVRVAGHDGVHNVEELDAAASFVMTADHLARGDVEGGEQRCRPMPLVGVRLADHRAPGGQLEISRRSLQRLASARMDGFSSIDIYKPTISAALDTNSGLVLSHQDLRPKRSIFWARRKRQIYCSCTSPSARDSTGAVQFE